MMIRYAVRARQIVDLLGEIRRGSLILSPYFQRKLVWRDIHKIDFIQTILRGFPFPEIFIAKGTLDVDQMASTSSVVDGQQRLNSIREFIADKIIVDGLKYSDLPKEKKSDFLKYEIAVIDLDLQDNDPQVVEMFNRLNRTFYSLSKIEKFSTEFSVSEFMLVAKHLSREIDIDEPDDAAALASDLEDINRPKRDPNVPPQFYEWAAINPVIEYQKFLLDSGIFSNYETSRMVHLMYTLNLIATYISGFYNRNDKSREFLETYAQEFPKKNEIREGFENCAGFLNRLKLPKGSMWSKKTNSFSLFALLMKNLSTASAIGTKKIRERLIQFSEGVPRTYEIASREGVNNRRERELRNDWISHALFDTPQPKEEI